MKPWPLDLLASVSQALELQVCTATPCWALNPGPRACEASNLLTELHSPATPLSSHLELVVTYIHVSGNKNPKKNFKTTFHNSGDNSNEAGRHLFVVLVSVEMQQSSEKTERREKYSYVAGKTC